MELLSAAPTRLHSHLPRLKARDVESAQVSLTAEFQSYIAHNTHVRQLQSVARVPWGQRCSKEVRVFHCSRGGLDPCANELLGRSTGCQFYTLESYI